ncbi:MAG TPA: hypothetical protein VD962_01265, partial [Rubricoccaceae bacterium]|nr:hypothetical protein [Rubricoccaceae bacterium]
MSVIAVHCHRARPRACALRFAGSFGVFALLALSPPASAQWVSTGGPGGGTARDLIEIDGALLVANNYDFFAADGGVYRSEDEGATWTLRNSEAPRPFDEFVRIGTAVFANHTGQGVFRSTDGGATWQPVNTGLGSLAVTALGVEGGDLYAGTSASGVFRSTNLGESWDPVNNGLPVGTEVTALASAGGAVFAGIWLQGVWRSLNDGASWEPVNNGLPPISTWGGPSTFAVVGSEVFVCVLTVQGIEGGVFRTSTLGDMWAPANNGLPSAGTQRANAVYAAGGLLFAH